jgi:hypothetical protein
VVKPVSRLKDWTYAHSMYIIADRVGVNRIEQGKRRQFLAPSNLKIVIQTGAFCQIC